MRLRVRCGCGLAAWCGRRSATRQTRGSVQGGCWCGSNSCGSNGCGTEAPVPTTRTPVVVRKAPTARAAAAVQRAPCVPPLVSSAEVLMPLGDRRWCSSCCSRMALALWKACAMHQGYAHGLDRTIRLEELVVLASHVQVGACGPGGSVRWHRSAAGWVLHADTRGAVGVEACYVPSLACQPHACLPFVPLPVRPPLYGRLRRWRPWRYRRGRGA